MPDTTSAAEIARILNIDPKQFRAALRSANLGWHSHYDRWEVTIGSPEHEDMKRVLAELLQDQLRNRPASPSSSRT